MKFKVKLLCLFLIAFSQAFSQQNFNPVQQKIAVSLTNYFKLDRENIHLHLNKNIYLTNESIWFKGYIIENKSSPALLTSNVYISLYDSNGGKVSSQLYYAENAVLEGRIKLNKTLASGKYYLRAFTNFMNNFAENESSLYEVTIINRNDKGATNSKKPNYETAGVTFFPESGNYVRNISNTIGVKIADCNGIGIKVADIQVADSKGNAIIRFSTDQFGYGKFDITPMEAESYKISYMLNEKKLEKLLPLPAAEGVSFSVVNYVGTKTVIKLKTNPKTLEKIKNTPYNITFQKNDKVVFAEFTFKETEQTVSISNTELPDGTATVYLIDQNLKNWGERVIYTPYRNQSKTLMNIFGMNKDSIAVTGVSPIKLGSMSVSILPANTLSESPLKPIEADFQMDNYLLFPSQNTAYYLTDFSRKKHFELDNFLLCERSKYNWDDMIQKTPIKTFDADAGLTIKGTVNTEVKDNRNMMINLKSLALGLNEFSRLNEKNEFFFEHILAQDSTKIYFMAIDDRVKKPGIKVYSQLLSNVRNFTKPLEITKSCPIVNRDENLPFPKIANAIMMDSVNVQSKKNKLVNENRTGNRSAHGFKITDKDIASNRDVLQFLRNNGYTTKIHEGTTFILDNSRALVFAPYGNDPQEKGPSVFIDGSRVMNYDILADYSLDRIDEIYINRRMFDLTRSGSMGIINIYSKTNSGIPVTITKSEYLLVKNGFQGFHPFSNPKYDNVSDEGFQKLGTIDWHPFVETDENGTFHFSIPNLYQQSVTMIVEGMSPDGILVSETIILNTQ